MTLSDVGVLGQQIDVVNGGDVRPDGSLASTAEVQQAFRELVRSRSHDAAAAAPSAAGQEQPQGPHTSRAPAATAPHTSVAAETGTPDTSAALAVGAPDTSPVSAALADAPGRTDRTGRSRDGIVRQDSLAGADAVDHDWVVVVAAHGGAGASCVALSLADGYDAAGRACRLMEVSHPARSGLVAAATAELGNDPTGTWRRGSRHLSTLYRRVSAAAPCGWPNAVAEGDAVTVVDLGLPAPASIGRLLDTGPRVVVVCRVTVPGLRAAEQLLAELNGARVVLAAVGASRWPGEVVASIGNRVRLLREHRQVVSVPDDRHLQVTGPTNSPLPKSVSAAGRELLGLIDAAHWGDAEASPNPSAQTAPRKRGKTR